MVCLIILNTSFQIYISKRKCKLGELSYLLVCGLDTKLVFMQREFSQCCR